MNRSVDFFQTQFERQVRESEFALNPFETLALPYLRGDVLDLGCGLGNLAIEAARRGSPVLALDASPAGVEHIRSVALAESLPIEADVADLSTYRIPRDFDTIVCIGLLMFLTEPHAHQLLQEIQSHVRPGGHAVVNVLIEGTTYMEMFEPGKYFLFGVSELEDRFSLGSSWNAGSTASMPPATP